MKNLCENEAKNVAGGTDCRNRCGKDKWADSYPDRSYSLCLTTEATYRDPTGEIKTNETARKVCYDRYNSLDEARQQKYRACLQNCSDL